MLGVGTDNFDALPPIDEETPIYQPSLASRFQTLASLTSKQSAFPNRLFNTPQHSSFLLSKSIFQNGSLALPFQDKLESRSAKNTTDERNERAGDSINKKGGQGKAEMAVRAEKRREQRAPKLKDSLRERIKISSFESSEASICKEAQRQDMRKARVEAFLARQEFKARQIQILREMQQFCRYGAVRRHELRGRGSRARGSKFEPYK